jgi:mRNA interferase MazF
LGLKRFEVWLVNLDPTIGSEIKKTSPVVIVSPDELNIHLATVIVVPLATGRSYPFRLKTRVDGKDSVAAIDQIRMVDKRRLVKKIDNLSKRAGLRILNSLGELFSF